MPAPVVARQPDRPGGGWFAAPLAQHLLREEQRQAMPLLATCFGQVGVYLRGTHAAPPRLLGHMLQSVMQLHRDDAGWAGDLVCSDVALPLQRECVDLVYMLHALEVCAQPRELLIELERALTPEGNLMLIVLNPYSPWRMRWSGHGLRAVGAGRCCALLRDSGFDVIRQYGLGPMLPWLRRRPWLALPEAGKRDPWLVWRAAYLIQARKRRHGITPLRARTKAVAFEPGMHPG